MQYESQTEEFDIEEARRILGDVFAPWWQDLGLSIAGTECGPPPPPGWGRWSRAPLQGCEPQSVPAPSAHHAAAAIIAATSADPSHAHPYSDADRGYRRRFVIVGRRGTAVDHDIVIGWWFTWPARRRPHAGSPWQLRIGGRLRRRTVRS